MPPLPSSLARIAAASGVIAVAAGLLPRQADEGRVLDATLHHLGDQATPEWTEAAKEPEPSPLVIAFDSLANAGEWVLFLASRDVDSDWWVELNGARLGKLGRGAPLKEQRFVVPAGGVATGRNELKIVPTDPKEDILVGRARLVEKSLREVLSLGRVEVTVRDRDGAPLPVRLSFADAAGKPVDLYYADARSTAVRPGVAYTRDGKALLELPPGRVTVWAGRGMEWSVAQATVEIAKGGLARVELAIEREVDTTGWIACDTHVHTLTHSGHGDISIEERMVALAGEGVELPIATDHNKQIDYRPVQAAMGVTEWFTPVVGNEVTTDNGHMNAFPLPAGGDVPPWKESDWEKLVAGIRAKGAQVVILNHPRWPEKGKDPFTKFGFDDRSGERTAPQRFTFDCLEVVNSDNPTGPPEAVLPGWYALLNRGERFTAIGASDSHHVGVIVGQGRTYVPSASDDPTAIDVAAACRSFREGRVTVSVGMFATIEVGGRGMGDTVGVAGDAVDATVVVRHPSWIAPQSLALVVDGTAVATVALDRAEPGDRPNEKKRRVRVPLPDHDAWLVAVASAPPIQAPFWPMSLPHALAITNPVWIDRDGDGTCASPRAIAAARLGAARDMPAVARVGELLPALDDGAAIQLLELARDAVAAELRPQLAALVAAAARPELAGWSKTHLAAP